MDFKLVEKERQRILTFIENHLLFVENHFMLNKFRDAIKYDSIPDLTVTTEAQKAFMDTKMGPYIYMVNWTPVGFRYMVINQLDECEDFTNETSLENWYNIQSYTIGILYGNLYQRYIIQVQIQRYKIQKRYKKLLKFS